MEGCRVVVGIDLGTSNSGIAYALLNEPTIVALHGDLKIPTVVMLERAPPHKLVDMGPKVLSRLEPDKHLIFHRFKMQLYDHPEVDMLQADVGGIALPKRVVFGRALEALKNRLLLKGLKDMRAEQILWVLTVPAIWSEAARAFMREAAVFAGLVDVETSPRLLLALEPECAALECHSSLMVRLQSGLRIAMLDCGGGTIDTTVYEVVSTEPLKLREVHLEPGGGWGSTRIDEALVELLRNLLGPLPSLEPHNEQLFEFLVDSWETAKKNFTLEEANDKKTKVAFSLSALLSNVEPPIKLSVKVAEYNRAHRLVDHDKVDSWGSGNLKLPSSMVRNLFDSVLEDIQQHVKKLVEDVPGLDQVILVGGFGDSPLLREAVQSALLGSSVNLAMPLHSSLAILMGAVRFGLQQDVFEARTARATYGISVSCPYDATIPLHQRAGSHRYFDDKLGYDRVKDIFKVFVCKNEPITSDSVVTQNFVPVYSDQTSITFEILASDSSTVEFSTDAGVTVLGVVVIDCPLDAARSASVSMAFGKSEIVVSVNPPVGHAKRVSIDFVHNRMTEVDGSGF